MITNENMGYDNMKWIDEIVKELRKDERIIGVHPKHYDVAYWFLHDNDWCDTLYGNCDIDELFQSLSEINHPERYFELLNDHYRFIDYDDKLKTQRISRGLLMRQHRYKRNWDS